MRLLVQRVTSASVRVNGLIVSETGPGYLVLLGVAAADTRREAARHFERGVALYGEADYRGALVEFKRTAALIPNPAVLYNIGETEYQLQEYASALTTFERYLKEAGPGDSHRAEVEGNVQALRVRVGHVIITTTAALPEAAGV